MRYQSLSRENTHDIAASVGSALLARPKARSATVVALNGTLGAGKTTFTQGLLRALGVRMRVTSPTFVLMHRYAIRKGPYKNAYHVDGYRLRHPDDFAALELDSIFADPTALVLVEWPERAGKLIPKGAIQVKFTHGKKENERRIDVAKL